MSQNDYYGQNMSFPKGTQGTAAKVRERLAAIRMTVQELSDSTGIGYSALQRRVRGEVEFTVGELIVVAQALEVPPGELIELPDREPYPSAEQEH